MITDQTPFYAEMGGQVSDAGALECSGESCPVLGVQQVGQARAHLISVADGVKPAVGAKVRLAVDTERRRAVEAHHSATHLLHRALRTVVSEDVAQQGSLVEADRLRFDVNSSPISKDQLRRVEELVNDWVQQDLPVSAAEHAMSEIRQHKEVCQFFGDKYGDTVRLVQMGGEDGKFDGVSMELCGGTHVRHTGAIGFFKIRSEGAIASGVRRIEASCGAAGYAVVREMIERHLPECKEALGKVTSVNAKLAELGQDTVPVPTNDEQPGVKALRAKDIRTVNTLLDQFFAYVAVLKEAAQEADKRLKKARAAAAASLADALLAEQLTGSRLVLSAEGGADLLTELFNGLRKRQFTGAAFLVVCDKGSLQLGAYCGEEAQAAGLSAGDLIRSLAPIVSGKGGGKVDMARGSGSKLEAKEKLLEAARKTLM